MNRHLKIAFIMAPIMALAGYGLTDLWLKKNDPEGAKGPLMLLGQCQPRDNACLFKNHSLEIKLISATKQDQLQLAAFTNEPVSEFSMALGGASGYQQFPIMKSDDGKYWQLKLESHHDITQFTTVRMAMKHKQVPMYAEASVEF